MIRNVLCHFQYLQKNFIRKSKNSLLDYVGVLNTVPVRWKMVSDDKEEEKVPPTMSSRYETFSEETAPIILDIEEERKKTDESLIEKSYNELGGLGIQRGVTGVFDIEELVELLRREKAEDIFVARIPPEFRYANYLIIVTGRSTRHMWAICEFIRKTFKSKMNESDKIPVLEGKNSKDWMALDLENIVVHVFSQSAREYYDLETLWAIGKEYDSLSRKKEDAAEDVLMNYSNLLASLTPDTPK